MTGATWRSDELAPPDGDAWDLLVLGGGTAGLVAAKTAASFGADVLMVERDRIGGDCLWTGCVPSKALLAAAHAATDARAAVRFGVRISEVDIDFAAVMRHVHATIRAIEPADSPAAMRDAGVHLAHGVARLAGRDLALVGGEPVRFRQALIATGSAPIVPSIPGLEAAGPLTNETVFGLAELPRRLLVIGGGSIGCELGQAFARVGSVVSIVEADHRLLPHEDPDAAALVAAALARDGVDVRVGATLSTVHAGAGAWRAELGDGARIDVDAVLVAVGRRPRTAELGLDAAGVSVDRDGFIGVDERLVTSNPRIWAAGDVTRESHFTHTAGVAGTLVAGNAILGLRRPFDRATTPRVTFTQPEVAAFGVGLEQALRRRLTVVTTPHAELDRAVAEDRTAGFSRLVFDRRGRVVGATIVGPRAGESLAEPVLAARHGLHARDLAAAIHAYPTYSDGVWKGGLRRVRAQLDRSGVERVIGLLAALRRRRLSG